MAARAEFRLYLEQTGVVDALANAMTALYCEDYKPDNAMDFLKRHIIAQKAKALTGEKDELQKKCQLLEEENQTLKSKLTQYEPSPEAAE
ncbi:c-Myc-binding protein-like isoform X2 [Vanacampus margaritifer]